MTARDVNSMLSVFAKMKIVQQANKLPIQDMDFLAGDEDSAKRKHGPQMCIRDRCMLLSYK